MAAAPYRTMPPDAYAKAWASLRRSRRTMVAVAVASAHVAAATFTFVVWSRSCEVRVGAIAVAVLAAAGCRIAFAMPFFRCPRCRRQFFRPHAGVFGLAAEHCQHCGLAVGARSPGLGIVRSD
jgi:hypothetical protein